MVHAVNTATVIVSDEHFYKTRTLNSLASTFFKTWHFYEWLFASDVGLATRNCDSLCGAPQSVSLDEWAGGLITCCLLFV